MLKQKNGITLVALVITIIVLLILAGVSISLVVGDNGVLTQAQSASRKTDAASADSAVSLALGSISTNFMSEIWTNNTSAKIYSHLSYKELYDELYNNGYTITGYKVADSTSKNNATAILGLTADTWTDDLKTNNTGKIDSNGYGFKLVIAENGNTDGTKYQTAVLYNSNQTTVQGTPITGAVQ